MGYIILTSDTPSKLEDLVDTYLNNGWKLSGGFLLLLMQIDKKYMLKQLQSKKYV